jgi:hypothetical protein
MNLSLTADRLRIEFEWYEQLWAFHLSKAIEVPLSHITRVTTTEPQSSWAEVRAPGTFVPGVIKAGTYYTRTGREFWYVTDQKNYLTLELHSDDYQRIVLTIENHEDWQQQIQQRRTAPV